MVTKYFLFLSWAVVLGQPFVADPRDLMSKILTRADQDLVEMLSHDDITYISPAQYDELRKDNILTAIKLKHSPDDPIEDFMNNQILKDQISHFKHPEEKSKKVKAKQPESLWRRYRNDSRVDNFLGLKELLNKITMY